MAIVGLFFHLFILDLEISFKVLCGPPTQFEFETPVLKCALKQLKNIVLHKNPLTFKNIFILWTIKLFYRVT